MSHTKHPYKMPPLSLIRGEVETTGPGSPKTFIEIFREFNRQDATENSHRPKTVYKYQNIADNFERYLIATGQPEIKPGHVSMPTLKYFVLWLPENLKSCNRTHIAKHVSRVKKALTYAVEMGIIPYNPCAGYHVKRAKNKEVVSLEDAEFSKWVNAQWENKLYQDAQGCYNMQMGAGLSYADLFDYKTAEHADGLWIEGIRTKTGRPYYVPLWHPDFALAKQMHEKYNGKFPKIENHFYNRLIREMAAILGIEKYITTHIGRKTWSIRFEEKGYSVPFRSSVLGNTEKVCTSHYSRASKNKIAAELTRRAS